MAKIVHYALTLTAEQKVYLPNGAQVLSVVNSDGLYLCALIEPSSLPDDLCTVYTFTRGEEVHERRNFLGSVVDEITGLVWHIFYTMKRTRLTFITGQSGPYYRVVESET